ncbi:MAG: hypothetical protein P8103_06640 [Candidatus Thiodiazotropha sp.]
MLTGYDRPLGIALLGINERDRVRLEMFLDHHWSSNCLLVTEKHADICILDLDSLDGKKVLRHQQESNPKRPLIVLSVHDTEINDVTLLRKPLSGNLLKDAINDRITKLVKQASEDEPLELDLDLDLEPEAEPTLESHGESNDAVVQLKLNDRRSALPDLATQARLIHGSCGPAGGIEFDNPASNDNLFYDPSTLFQHLLKNAIEQSRRENVPVRLSLPDEKYVVLLPEPNLALTNLSDSKLRPRCLLPIKQHQARIDYPGDSEISQLKVDSGVEQDMDGLLWKVSLWSARGRLPLGTKIDTTIGLRHWPNLTRLMTIPQFMRIAALWAKTPLPLSKTVEFLNIEARYVCAFFSACYALELTQTLTTTEDLNNLQSESQQSTAPKGLLRRILRRLRMT